MASSANQRTAAVTPERVAAVQDYALSADGDHLILRRGKNFSLVDAKPGADFDKGAMKLDGMELRIEPPREWQQLFVDAWRILRDWFYDPGMHGQDWNAIRAQYEPLVAHVKTRADLEAWHGEIDCAVSGLGTCGSCTMWSVRDAIGVEANGKPVAAAICEEFVGHARTTASFLGHPELKVLVLPYPLETRPEPELQQIAEEYYPKFLTLIGAER